MAIVWVVLIYWLAFFVVCLIVVEMFHDWFYDEVTPHSGLKVGVGSLLLALMAAWLRPSFDTMFTTDIAWTLLQALVWFVVFMFIFQFHPGHALGVGLVTMVLVTALASLGVDSLMKPSRTLAPVQARPNNQPIRRAVVPAPVAPAPAAKK